MVIAMSSYSTVVETGATPDGRTVEVREHICVDQYGLTNTILDQKIAEDVEKHSGEGDTK